MGRYDPDILTAAAPVTGSPLVTLQETVSARRIAEPGIVASLAHSADPVAVRRVLGGLRPTLTPALWLRQDRHVRRQFILMLDNAHLKTWLTNLWRDEDSPAIAAVWCHLVEPPHALGAVQYHRALLTALMDGNAERAAVLMREHLTLVEQWIRRHFAP